MNYLSYMILTIAFLSGYSAHEVAGQGAKLTPPQLYQTIPTRAAREVSPESEPLNLEIASPVAEETASTQTPSELQDNAEIQFNVDEAPLLQSIPPEIDPRWGPDSEIKLPAQFDLVDYLPTPGEQTRNDCVAWAIAHSAYSCQIGQERRKRPTSDCDLFSPAFIFEQLGGNPNGLHAMQVINFVQNTGCATMASMSLSKSEVGGKDRVEANNFKAQRHERAASIGDIKSYIYEGYPVVLIVQMGGDFQSDAKINAPYNWRDEQNKLTGYHAIAAVGFDDARKAFLIMNSWGTQWKDCGFCWVSYENFDQIDDQSWCAEAHVVGVKNYAPIYVSMESSGGRRSRFGRSSYYSGRTFRLGTDRKIYEGRRVVSPDQWVFDDITCNRNNLYALGRDQTVYRLNDEAYGNSWTHLDGGIMANKKVTMMAGDHSTELLVLTDGQEMFQYDQRAGRWDLVKLPKKDAEPVDVRITAGKICATTSVGDVFTLDQSNHWSLAP
ncbi:C1 family peptidase [Rubripirellula reticaptiva]|uniref:Papain family cysteine protease n=1 Tax=Rubripirellula reticaptiva TaxID=2528013 RepID=A0A5C6EJ84_9BACT|nr:C1 family peptidase [Rubripirellula reticaptiva]TWU49142.1 Papain family cysteine protease [Rubripirellula reticaptiva]